MFGVNLRCLGSESWYVHGRDWEIEFGGWDPGNVKEFGGWEQMLRCARPFTREISEKIQIWLQHGG